MRAFKRLKARGFTLVELMIVVAIIGVLAALAIFGVRRYLATAKSAEARNTIGAINRGAVSAYEREFNNSEMVQEGQTSTKGVHALCDSSLPVPPGGAADVKGVKYQPSTVADDPKGFNTGSSTSGWKCLRFGMSQATYYSYVYLTAGFKAVNNWNAPQIPGWQSYAEGDLNGNDVPSKFASGGEISKSGQPKVFTQVAEENPDELSSRVRLLNLAPWRPRGRRGVRIWVPGSPLL